MTAAANRPTPEPPAAVLHGLQHEEGTIVTEPSTRKAGVPLTHGACGATWTAPGACHCSGCGLTFSGIGLFDRHRSIVGEHGKCADPATLTRTDGTPVCEYRDGMWRYPEMDDATKLARFGAR